MWVSALEQIKKRDGRVVAFDPAKIAEAILKAAHAVQGRDEQLAGALAEEVVRRVEADAQGAIPEVEAIQDAIEKVLIEQGHARTAKAFILYRARRSRIREGKTELMDAVADIVRDAPLAGADKLHAIGLAASREYYLNRFLPEAWADAHLSGRLHLHGLAHYGQSPQAFVLPLRTLLEKGFSRGHATMRPPRRAASAAALVAIAVQSALVDVHGGVSLASFDADLAAVLPPATTQDELDQAMEAFVFALHTTPAPQLPRLTVHVGFETSELGQRVTRALLKAFDAGLGRGEAALTPHLVYSVRAGHNAQPEDPAYALTRYAAEVATRRLGLSFGCDVSGAALVGAQARLQAPAEGRSQIARVSVNLPRTVLAAKRGGQAPDEALAATLDAACDQLRHRFETLAERPVAELPFLMGQALHAGSAELAPDAPIRAALATGELAVGVLGLAEALVALGGSHHGESPESQAEGLQLIKRMNEHLARRSAADGLRYVLQASDAAESGERMVRQDRRDFGIIKGVTDQPGYTDGVAVPTSFALSAAERLAIEGAYVPHMPGGSFPCLPLAGAPQPEEVLGWLQAAQAAGHVSFSLSFPQAVCRACGHTGAPDGCTACGAEAGAQRPLRNQRGYWHLAD